MTPIDEKYHKKLQCLRHNKHATKDDVRHIYDDWAAEYDQVRLGGYQLSKIQTYHD